ncbi:hypothetical protein ACFFWB_07615 [Flavobacterium procerum]|uniref:hypothetical protein n=1 Tax=Flavobacterium procerum TaxID=1455569 RepID=UPI0035E59D33
MEKNVYKTNPFWKTRKIGLKKEKKLFTLIFDLKRTLEIQKALKKKEKKGI